LQPTVVHFLKESRVIQGVSEISALILTGNRTHQKEQLFSLSFWRKTLRNGLKNRKDFPKTVHISKTKPPKNVKQPDSYEGDFFAIWVDLFEFRFRR
jgi:hypothetical protein